MGNQGRKPKYLDVYRAILTLKNVDECVSFFEDLCTVKELQSIEQRFEVARLLDEGMIYTEILELTGASSATISRVNRCLRYGEEGYRVALDRLRLGDAKREDSESGDSTRSELQEDDE